MGNYQRRNRRNSSVPQLLNVEGLEAAQKLAKGLTKQYNTKCVGFVE